MKRSLVISCLVVGIGIWTSSAHAAPAEWAYLFADQPTAASYTPAVTRNSSGAANTVTRSGVGVYFALLPNLAALAGTVHVTANGGGRETCKVASWGPMGIGTTQQVDVRCFNVSGAPADSTFSLSYTNPIVPDGAMAYLWAHQETAPLNTAYTPMVAWQFNSTGAPNTVTRTGVGAYKASLPNMGTGLGHGGHVQVTAYGTGSERCKVKEWWTIGSTEHVFVRCFSSTGMPVDARFTMTFVNQISLIGAASVFFGASNPSMPGESGAYVWADRQTTANYTPQLNYQWDDFSSLGGTISVQRSAAGIYSVDFNNHSLNTGEAHLQITAYGSDSTYCKVSHWNNAAGVRVHCFDSAGAVVDSRFTLALLDHWQGYP